MEQVEKIVVKIYKRTPITFRRNFRLFLSKFIPNLTRSFDNGNKENNLKLDNDQKKMLTNYVREDYAKFKILILNTFGVELPEIKA